MNATVTVNVQGEIRMPDIALLAQAMLGHAQLPAPVPAPAPIPEPAPAPTPVPAIPQTPIPAPAAPVQPMPPAAPQAAIPAAPSAPAPTPNPIVPVTEAPKYSIDDIARAGAELAQQGPHKIGELTGLLQQFGLQAVTQLRPDQMAPFVVALRGLGARI